MTAEGAPSPVRGVKRDKSLALDDVFASRHFGGKSFDKGGVGARSVSGDLYKSKDKLRNHHEEDESGADTDTGHSVATTGPRSRRRASRKTRVGSFSRRAVEGQHKTALHTFNTSGSQLINVLYKSNDNDTEDEDEENDPAPEEEDAGARSNRKESKAKYVATSSRSALTADRKSRDPSPSRDRHDHKDRNRSSSALISREHGDKSGRSRRTRREATNGSSDSPHKSNRDRKLQHHPHHHSTTERHRKAEPHYSHDHHRRKREESHRTSSTTHDASMEESAGTTSKALSRARDSQRVSGPSKPGRKKTSDEIARERISSSRHHRSERSRSKVAPPSPRSPSAHKTASGHKSVCKTREKVPSPKEDSPTSITEHTDANLSSPMKNRLRDVPRSPRRSPTEKEDEPHPSLAAIAGTRSGSSVEAVDVSESEEADDTGHARDPSTVLQFDPSQDDSVYRVRQVTSTHSTITIANSDGTSVEGQIAEFVDPVGEAQQLQGHSREMPIFDFLESEEFDFPAENHHAVAPLDLPSGGEEDDGYDAENGHDAGIHCSQGSLNYYAEPRGPDETVLGYDDYYNDEQSPSDNRFGYGTEPADPDNPYEYGIDYVPPHRAFDDLEPEQDVDDNPYVYDGYEPEWNQDGAAYDEPLHSTGFDESFEKSEVFSGTFQGEWSPKLSFDTGESHFSNDNFGFDDHVQFGEPEDTQSPALRCPSGGEEEDIKPVLSQKESEHRDGIKKKRLVKVKVVKKKPGASDRPNSKAPPSDSALDETGKPSRPKVVKKKLKPAAFKPQRKQERDEDDRSQHSDEFSLDNVETTAQKKKHLSALSLSAPFPPGKSPATPTKALMAKLQDSISRMSTADDKDEDEAAGGSSSGKAVSHHANTLSSLSSLPPKSPLRSQPKGGASPANSTSSKKKRSVRLATSIGRYFSRSSRNVSADGSGVGAADEGSISSNSRGSRGLFRGKTKQHQLLGDDSSYDSGNIQY